MTKKREFTKEEIEQGYYIKEVDSDICSACGEHAEFCFDLEEGEPLGSNCCGASEGYLD